MSTDNRAVKVWGEDGFEQPSDIGIDIETVKAQTTQQEAVEDDFGPVEWYDPPFDPEELLLLGQRSEPHSSCVEAKSKAVAGHGFEIVPHESADPEGVPTVLADFWFGNQSTFTLGPSSVPGTASEVFEHAWNDFESVGWLAVEILVNPNSGQPTGLAHVPSYTIRKRKDDRGYVQIDDGSKIVQFFGEAGDRYGDEQHFIDAETGEVDNSTGSVGTVANELLIIRNYTSGSPRYGLPDIIPAVETLAGDLAAREFNQRFFANDTVPRIAVTVSGGELTDRAWEDLEQTFRDLREQKNAHRGVLIEATSSVAQSIGDANGVDIDIQPLTVGVDEDAGFTDYRDNNEHYILQAHGVPPVVVGRTEGINFANAKSQRVNFAQTTIRPKQTRLATRLYQILHVQAFEIDEWTIEFGLYGGENKQREAETAQIRTKASRGSLTVNEARSELGYEPLDGEQGEVLLATLKKGGTGTGGGSMPPGESREAYRQPQRPSRRALLKAQQTFREGDVVEIDDGGLGVVVEVRTEDFEAFSEEGETIDASPESPVYVVALKAGGFRYMSAGQLTPSSFDENGDPDELKESFIKADSTFSLPEGWTRATLLDAWASMGGSFTGCVAEMKDEGVDEDDFCAAMKDRVLGTELWR